MGINHINIIGLLIYLLICLALFFLCKRGVSFSFLNVFAMFIGVLLNFLIKDNGYYIKMIWQIYALLLAVLIIMLLWCKVICPSSLQRNVKKVYRKSIPYLHLSIFISISITVLIVSMLNLGYNSLFGKLITPPKYLSMLVGIVFIINILMALYLAYKYIRNKKVAPYLIKVQTFFSTTFDIFLGFLPFIIVAIFAGIKKDSILNLFIILLQILFITYIICIIYMYVINSILLVIFTKVSPITFFKRTRQAIKRAYKTQSSNATLQTSVKCLEGLGVRTRLARATLEFGAKYGMVACAGIWPTVLTVVSINMLGYTYDFKDCIIITIEIFIFSIISTEILSIPIVSTGIIFIFLGIPLELIILTIPISMLVNRIRTATNVSSALVCSLIISKKYIVKNKGVI